MWSGNTHLTSGSYPTQWALNPAAYVNMPNEQVDWASLAQQWIKMKESQPGTDNQALIQTQVTQQVDQPGPTGPVTLPITNVVDPAPPGLGLPSQPIASALTHNQGFFPLNPDGLNVPGAIVGNTSGANWWNWDGGGTGPMVSGTPAPNWNPSVTGSGGGWENEQPFPATSKISTSQAPPHISSGVALPPPPPIIHSYTSSGPPPYKDNEPAWSSSGRNVGKNDWSGGSGGGGRPQKHHRHHQNMSQNQPVHQSSVPPQATLPIDAIKRKQLPAWIREGLEKMEREKLKKQQQSENYTRPLQDFNDTSVGISNNSIANGSPERIQREVLLEPSRSRFDVEDDTERDARSTDKSASPVRDESPVQMMHHHHPPPSSSSHQPHPPQVAAAPLPLEVQPKSKEEIFQSVMTGVGRILTQLLMEVTNEEVMQTVSRVLQKHKIKGLGIYDSDNSGSDSDLESDHQIRARIKKRQEEFNRREVEIEKEIEEQEEREKRVLFGEQDAASSSGGNDDEDRGEIDGDKSGKHLGDDIRSPHSQPIVNSPSPASQQLVLNVPAASSEPLPPQLPLLQPGVVIPPGSSANSSHHHHSRHSGSRAREKDSSDGREKGSSSRRSHDKSQSSTTSSKKRRRRERSSSSSGRSYKKSGSRRSGRSRSRERHRSSSRHRRRHHSRKRSHDRRHRSKRHSRRYSSSRSSSRSSELSSRSDSSPRRSHHRRHHR